MDCPGPGSLPLSAQSFRVVVLVSEQERVKDGLFEGVDRKGMLKHPVLLSGSVVDGPHRVKEGASTSGEIQSVVELNG